MVRNDEFFLRKWVAYYGAQLGMENLYVYLDGKDQPIPDWCPGVNITACERVQGQVAKSDKGRINFLTSMAERLFERYDAVIGTDADEFLIPDPACGKTLVEFISGITDRTTISGLGIDVGQHLEQEQVIDENRSFLSQRHYGLLGTRYTKASVIFKPVVWGSGFHRVKGHNFHIMKDLYLFHFGYFDMKRIQDRFNDKDRAAAGWTRHLAKRSETIQAVTRGKVRDWDRWTDLGRRIQTWVRPPYAWNKPAMFNMKIVVRIPDRFSSIV